MKRSTILFLIAVFLGGLLTGFLATAALPERLFLNLYRQWGLWGTVGRAAIALLLIGVPAFYVVWLVSSATEAMRPRRPSPVVPLFSGVTGLDDLKRVLVPVGGGRNALLGLHVAADLARAEQARITLMRVVPPSATSEVDVLEQKQRLRHLAGDHLGSEDQIQVRVVADDSVVRAIVDEVRAGGYDLLVVGASDRRPVRSLLFGTIPHALAEQAPCPVLVVRAAPLVES